jgi:hypothetical protein
VGVNQWFSVVTRPEVRLKLMPQQLVDGWIRIGALAYAVPDEVEGPDRGGVDSGTGSDGSRSLDEVVAQARRCSRHLGLTHSGSPRDSLFPAHAGLG